jgi:hypothetical protein
VGGQPKRERNGESEKIDREGRERRDATRRRSEVASKSVRCRALHLSRRRSRRKRKERVKSMGEALIEWRGQRSQHKEEQRGSAHTRGERSQNQSQRGIEGAHALNKCVAEGLGRGSMPEREREMSSKRGAERQRRRRAAKGDRGRRNRSGAREPRGETEAEEQRRNEGELVGVGGAIEVGGGIGA